MHTTPQTTRTIADAPTTTVPAYRERRTRLRLRDLCDEVIASYRAATGSALFPEHERSEAQRLLARVAPRPTRG